MLFKNKIPQKYMFMLINNCDPHITHKYYIFMCCGTHCYNVGHVGHFYNERILYLPEYYNLMAYATHTTTVLYKNLF